MTGRVKQSAVTHDGSGELNLKRNSFLFSYISGAIDSLKPSLTGWFFCLQQFQN